MKKIISASRRTDIPAFYTGWLLKRLYAGFVYVKNPYSGKMQRVSLKPEEVHSIVLWSKDFSPLLKRVEEVEKAVKNLFFHFTITGVPRGLEPGSPPWREAIKDLSYISRRYSPYHVVWRFDPIVITDKTPFEAYEEAFARMSDTMRGRVTEVYISFVEAYGKVKRNFGLFCKERLMEIDEARKKGFAERLSVIAGRNGMRLYACCNGFLLSGKIQKGRCVDGERLSRLFDDSDVSVEPAPTREGCGCTRAVDIGSYDTCPNGCLYCYATADSSKAKEFYRGFDQGWNGLGFNIEEGAT